MIQAILLLAVTASPAFAQRAPEIVIPGKPGVPVYINGIDASWGVVEGDFGLDRPGMVTPTVIYRPLYCGVADARTELSPRNRQASRLRPPGDRAAAGPAAAAAGADLLPQLVERVCAGSGHRISALRAADRGDFTGQRQAPFTEVERFRLVERFGIRFKFRSQVSESVSSQ